VKPRGLKSISTSVQPNFTSSVSGAHFISPGDFATIYDLKPFTAAVPRLMALGRKL